MKSNIDILFLSEQDVEKCINYKEGVELSEEAYKRIGANQAKEDRSKFMQAGEIFLGWQAGYAQDYNGFQFMVSLVKDRPQDAGLRAAYAISTLFDPKTGVPLAVMSAVTYIRAVKTGAASAIAAKRLAKKDSTKLALIGTGAMGRGQFLAMREIFNLKKLQVFDISAAGQESFVNEMNKYGTEIVPMKSVQEAVKGMDIVILCTSADEPLFRKDWLEEGMLVLKIGTNQELEPEVIKTADKLATDWWEYTMVVRSKELKLLLQQGLTNEAEIKDKKLLYAELPELVMGTKKGRESDSEKILSIQLGRSADYSTCMTYAYRRALELGLGQKLRLM
jgi:ornithine cyclodeaminase/alanine dehydrogenase-like protein (mu-crystallin family)